MRNNNTRQQGGAEASMETRFMPIDSILSQLASIADSSRSSISDGDPDGSAIFEADVRACEAATEILSALQDEGINDPQQVRDLIFDYNEMAKQYRAERKATQERERKGHIANRNKRGNGNR